jgi:hypothetical protein
MAAIMEVNDLSRKDFLQFDPAPRRGEPEVRHCSLCDEGQKKGRQSVEAMLSVLYPLRWLERDHWVLGKVHWSTSSPWVVAWAKLGMCINNNNNNYTFPVRRPGVHLDHLKSLR